MRCSGLIDDRPARSSLRVRRWGGTSVKGSGEGASSVVEQFALQPASAITAPKPTASASHLFKPSPVNFRAAEAGAHKTPPLARAVGTAQFESAYPATVEAVFGNCG